MCDRCKKEIAVRTGVKFGGNMMIGKHKYWLCNDCLEATKTFIENDDKWILVKYQEPINR